MSEQPPADSLADLLVRAEHFAEFAMRKIGSIPPTLLAESPGGPIFFVPSAMGDEQAKDNFANTARLICIAHDVTVAVMILEAWMKLAPADGSLDPNERPSEALDRREVVMLTGENSAGPRHKILPIIRTDAGGFFGFGEFEGPESNRFEGRFANILPPSAPSPDLQARARKVLAAMGLNESVLRGDDSLN
jgi:hypothetical protein